MTKRQGGCFAENVPVGWEGVNEPDQGDSEDFAASSFFRIRSEKKADRNPLTDRWLLCSCQNGSGSRLPLISVGTPVLTGRRK